MNEFEATGIMILLFALRCALPAVLMLGLGYLMNWWVDRLRQEDEARAKGQPQYCPAYVQHGNRCWSVCMREQGVLPAACVNCPIYKQAMQGDLQFN